MDICIYYYYLICTTYMHNSLYMIAMLHRTAAKTKRKATNQQRERGREREKVIIFIIIIWSIIWTLANTVILNDFPRYSSHFFWNSYVNIYIIMMMMMIWTVHAELETFKGFRMAFVWSQIVPSIWICLLASRKPCNSVAARTASEQNRKERETNQRERTARMYPETIDCDVLANLYACVCAQRAESETVEKQWTKQKQRALK